MRSPLLALLPALFAIVLAPTAPVYTASKAAAEKTVEKQEQAEQSKQSGPRLDQEAQAPKSDDNNEKKQKDQRVPARTYWCELTPVFPTGDGPVPDETEPGLCPEPAPALSARRLPVVLRFPEPPTEPDDVSLRSGHLALPPPVA